MSMTRHQFMALSQHGFYRFVYYEWGDPANDQVLVCVHGLTRCGRDFDMMASAMADRYRVICVDLPGRGNSDWLPVAADYTPHIYVVGLAALLARIGAEKVDWVGVSLGGLLGMLLAAQPNTPIRRLVLDDIGAYIGIEPLERIANYVGTDPAFSTKAELEAFTRKINVGYGPLTDAEWGHLIEMGSRYDEPTATWRQGYDPRIIEPFREGFSKPQVYWPLWQAIQGQVLIMRGSLSDLLTEETTNEMLATKPQAQLVEFEGVGHAPMLMAEDQIAAVRNFLTGAA